MIKNRKSKYAICLQDDKKSTSTYRVEKELFDFIKIFLEPYRSIRIIPKPVKCIETGVIYENARYANDWLIREGITKNYEGHIIIKDTCKGKREVAYGFHWEYYKEQ